jgi:hypothetical protein
MPELTVVDSNTCTVWQPYVRVDLNPMPELSLSPGQGLRIWTLLPTRVSKEIQRGRTALQHRCNGGLLFDSHFDHIYPSLDPLQEYKRNCKERNCKLDALLIHIVPIPRHPYFGIGFSQNWG